jgi:hypothetical protein
VSLLFIGSCSFNKKDKLPAFSKNNSTISKAIREKKKTFYRVLSNDKNKLEIDTLSSLTIYDGLVIDKLSMDWYIINTVNMKYTESKITFSSTKESSYLEYEDKNIIDWSDLTIEWYKDSKIEKNIKFPLIWNYYHGGDLYNMLIDSIDLKESKYPFFKWEE